MNERHQDITDRVQELITLNVRKGELYRIAFSDQPALEYEGIPVPSKTSDDAGVFDLKIHTPEPLRGRTVQCAADKVVLLEKVR